MLLFTRTLVVLGLLLGTVLLSGCDAYVLRVVLTDLEESDIDGLEVYRIDDTTGSLTAAGVYRFTGMTTTEEGSEMMAYELTSVSGEKIRSASWVERDPQDPSLVTLSLVYSIELPAGRYKVAAYNDAGTSPPSIEDTFF